MTSSKKSNVIELCPRCKKGYLKLTSFLTHIFTEEKVLCCNKCDYKKPQEKK